MFTKFGLGERVPGEHPHAKFHRCSLKIWVYSPQNRQNWYFLYTFAQNGYTPLCDFYKIWLGGGSPRSASSYQISPFWLKNVGLQPQKSRKIAIFGINLPLWKNFGGLQKKLSIGAQLQTFLYAMTS